MKLTQVPGFSVLSVKNSSKHLTNLLNVQILKRCSNFGVDELLSLYPSEMMVDRRYKKYRKNILVPLSALGRLCSMITVLPGFSFFLFTAAKTDCSLCSRVVLNS